MMIRQVNFLGLVRQYPQGGGVMTFATGRAPCISVVSWISFNLLFSSNICCLWPPFLLGPISPYLDVRPTLDFLLFYFITCSSCFTTGLAIGGAWGVREGARRPLAVLNTRLRINSILNSVTRRGTFIGNSAGVAGKFVIP